MQQLDLERQLDHSGLRRLMHQIDHNGDGFVSCTEFAALVMGADEPPPAAGAVRRSRWTLDVGHAGCRDVLKMAAERLGWEVVLNCGGTVVWVDEALEATNRVARRGRGEWISWIPGVKELCGKVALGGLLQARAAEFWPRTWLVPPATADAISKDAFGGGATTTLIVKPDEGSQGSGIGLAQSHKELRRLVGALPQGGAIVQEYVDRPLLIDGCKWDARIYVLMFPSPGGGHACFLAQEGLVRVCVEPYERPHSTNLNKTSIHLTNYSLSKFSAKFDHGGDPDDPTQGCKRTLSAVLRRFETEAEASTSGISSAAATWDALGSLAHDTVAAISEQVEASGGNDASGLQQCFHILGLDVLLDVSGRPWLLEANHRPSLLIDEVHPLAGGHSRAEANRLMAAARSRGGERWGKPCRCGLHPQLHEHQLSSVDVAAKAPVVEGALRIAQRAKRGGDTAGWAEGTIYTLV